MLKIWGAWPPPWLRLWASPVDFEVWHFPIQFLAKNSCFLSLQWVGKMKFHSFSPCLQNFFACPWKNPLLPFPLEKNPSDAHECCVGILTPMRTNPVAGTCVWNNTTHQLPAYRERKPSNPDALICGATMNMNKALCSLSPLVADVGVCFRSSWCAAAGSCCCSALSRYLFVARIVWAWVFRCLRVCSRVATGSKAAVTREISSARFEIGYRDWTERPRRRASFVRVTESEKACVEW